jgi:hypothetical protein
MTGLAMKNAGGVPRMPNPEQTTSYAVYYVAPTIPLKGYVNLVDVRKVG